MSINNINGLNSSLNLARTTNIERPEASVDSGADSQVQVDSFTFADAKEKIADVGKKALQQAQEMLGEAKSGLAAFKKDIQQKIQGDLPEDAIRLKGTHGDDHITIDQQKDGSLTVTINDKEHTFTPEESKHLVIEGGAGDDTIVATENVTVPLYILGGRGNDTIVGGKGDDYIRGGKGNDHIIAHGGNNKLFGDEGHDKIIGGAGNDFIDGGKGNDTILATAGNNIIYGGPGNDNITGGAGNDFINAGSGKDTVHGGGGDDIIFGGRGDDKLYGGDGNDIIVGGLGKDYIDGGEGVDKIRIGEGGHLAPTTPGDEVVVLNPVDIPKNINLDPLTSDRFRSHMKDNLEAMASIEPGQALLQGLGEAGRHIFITDTKDANGYATAMTKNGDAAVINHNPDGTVEIEPGRGTGSVISINPMYTNMYDGSEPWSATNSMIITAHELSHAYNSATGTMDNIVYNDTTGKYADSTDEKAVDGAEFQAVGMQRGDAQSKNPYGIAENDYRDFLNMPERTSYLRSKD